jgi:hypothetical protein
MRLAGSTGKTQDVGDREAVIVRIFIAIFREPLLPSRPGHWQNRCYADRSMIPQDSAPIRDIAVMSFNQ